MCCNCKWHARSRLNANVLRAFADCKEIDAETVLEPIDCKVARERKVSCMASIGGVTLILSLLSLVAFIGMFVPLCMLCCCTKNPHKVCFLPRRCPTVWFCPYHHVQPRC